MTPIAKPVFLPLHKQFDPKNNREPFSAVCWLLQPSKHGQTAQVEESVQSNDQTNQCQVEVLCRFEASNFYLCDNGVFRGPMMRDVDIHQPSNAIPFIFGLSFGERPYQGRTTEGKPTRR